MSNLSGGKFEGAVETWHDRDVGIVEVPQHRQTKSVRIPETTATAFSAFSSHPNGIIVGYYLQLVSSTESANGPAEGRPVYATAESRTRKSVTDCQRQKQSKRTTMAF